MAHLTPAEFAQTVEALAAHFGVERLRERLAKMNAFTSRRGLNTPTAIADRLHLLSGGLVAASNILIAIGLVERSRP